ncbi:MAG: SulP family inorganic anion transporter [Acidobacteriota bacterium]|nr:SulP family inorganic anion transporter [Acidobacteriota bacterium]
MSSTSRIPSALTLGLIAGSNVVVTVVPLGSVIFSGALAAYAVPGTRLVLLGNAIVCLFVALGSGFRGAVGMSPPATLVVLAGIAATLSLQADALFATMIATISIGSLATGLCATLLGSFKRANLVRFVPYPLACGFVAGIGALCFKIALSLMGATPGFANLQSILDPLTVLNWGLGTAYGLGLFLLTRRRRSLLILPVGFVLAIAAFYFVLSLLGGSLADAEANGLLLASVSESASGGLLPLFDPAVLGLVDWTAVAMQAPSLLTLVLITLLCLVIYLGAFELAGGMELDWNNEFRTTGLASMAAGIGGTPPGCLSVPPSLRNLMFGVEMRIAGISAALFIATICLFGNAALRLVPTPIVGGVLMFTGATLLDTWLVKIRRRLPRPEFAIVILIFLTILFFGFLVAVGVGTLVLVGFLLTRLASVDPVASRFTARDRGSSRSRPVPDRAILRMHGERVHAYTLRGYIFFGTAHSLAERLKQSLNAEEKPICILLDFDATTGADVSAVNAIGRFILAAHQSGTRLALSGMSKELDFGLKRDLPASAHDRLLLAEDTDEALEHCEDLVLAAHTETPGDQAEGAGSSLLEAVADDLTAYLDRQILFEDLVSDLDPWLEPVEFAAGETLAATGGRPLGALLMARGRAALFDASGNRLAEYGPGDVIGRVDGAPATTANDVRASEPCRALLLTPAAAAWLEKNEEALMLRFYRYVVTHSASWRHIGCVRAARGPTA